MARPMASTSRRAIRTHRRSLAAALSLCCALGATASLAAAAPPPLPEPNAVANLLPRPCAYDGGDRYEAAFYRAEGWLGP